MMIYACRCGCNTLDHSMYETKRCLVCENCQTFEPIGEPIFKKETMRFGRLYWPKGPTSSAA